jgi:hypothetical protein
MSSAVNARYVNAKFNKETDDEEKKSFKLEQCFVTNFSRFSLIDNSLIGTNFGEIFAIRFPALYVDKSSIQ